MKKTKLGWRSKSLKCRVTTLVQGWEHLENKLKELPDEHPMRMVIPALQTCREQLEDVIKGGEHTDPVEHIKSKIGAEL